MSTGGNHAGAGEAGSHGTPSPRTGPQKRR